jgi:LuxR family maltose regulon positive regulatory protein
VNKLSSLASTLLVTKQDSPATTSAQVPRAGVCDLVSASPSVKLILVSAPAGFGKTTTMVQCRKQLGESGLDTGWMTIDSADNDTSRFLICLAAVVREMTTDQPVRANEFTLAAPHSLGHLALDIMNRLASHPAPFALFLDDVDLLQEPTVLRLLREIIGHLPRRGQLIIGSRRVPDLGLSRLRARGQLLEIDAQSLRFSIGETMEFFTQCRGLPLREEDLLQLHRKTEGWITALWLASLALERRADRSEFIRHFSGSDRAVAGYLAEDVLTNQPPYMRDFLLRTSILRHLSESLCNALLPQTDSAAILTQLEEAGLFLAPVEGAQKAYRYHNLFAEFLRMQLSREMPEEFTRLHWAASQWYESQGRIVPAIDHALEGGNYEHVVRLLTQYGESLLHEGRMRLLARWFAAIPENFLRTSALLQVIHV